MSFIEFVHKEAEGYWVLHGVRVPTHLDVELTRDDYCVGPSLGLSEDHSLHMQAPRMEVAIEGEPVGPHHTAEDVQRIIDEAIRERNMRLDYEFLRDCAERSAMELAAKVAARNGLGKLLGDGGEVDGTERPGEAGDRFLIEPDDRPRQIELE